MSLQFGPNDMFSLYEKYMYIFMVKLQHNLCIEKSLHDSTDIILHTAYMQLIFSCTCIIFVVPFKEKPDRHWPNVISILTEHSMELDSFDKVIYICDEIQVNDLACCI